jgi:hypothetical protein
LELSTLVAVVVLHITVELLDLVGLAVAVMVALGVVQLQELQTQAVVVAVHRKLQMLVAEDLVL